MAKPACPSCRADLEEDLIASTGRAECPFCGAKVSPSDFAPVESFDEALREGSTDSPSPARRSAPSRRESDPSDVISFDDKPFEESVAGEAEPEVKSTSEIFGANKPIPPGSGIQVVEATDDRQVIFVPAGGKTAGIGFFAIVWNGFMFLFTSLMAVGFKQKPGDPPIIFVFLFLGLFWSVGLGMLYFWIRLRFTRTFLLLDRGQLVVQRILFGRKKVTETVIGPESRATLVESYSENDKPVYAVALNGTNRIEKFGTALSQEEKEWFVDTINGFLGAAGIAAACEEILQKTGGEIIDAMPPASLPGSSEITVDDASAERLAFHLPIVPEKDFKKVFGCVGMLMLVSTSIPFVMVLFMGGNAGFLFNVMFITVPALILFVGFFAWRGELAVQVTRDRLLCYWHWGRIGFRKHLPTASITRIALVRTVTEKRNGRPVSPPPGPNSPKVCVVFAGRDSLPLTTFHRIETSREAGGIVRHQLESMGFQIEDA